MPRVCPAIDGLDAGEVGVRLTREHRYQLGLRHLAGGQAGAISAGQAIGESFGSRNSRQDDECYINLPTIARSWSPLSGPSWVCAIVPSRLTMTVNGRAMSRLPRVFDSSIAPKPPINAG